MPNRLKIELDLGEKPVIASSPLRADLERAMAERRDGREPARRRGSAPEPGAPRVSRDSPTTCSTTRRAASTARRSPCSTATSTPTAARSSTRTSTCRATCPACSTRPSSRACSNAAARSASIAKRAPSRHSTATWACGCPRATRRATCCSPTRSTWWSWPRVDLAGNPVSRAAAQGVAVQGAVALVVGTERRLAGAVRAERKQLRHQAGDAGLDSDGRGQWSFEIKYPEWGRYLVRVCDLDGGHCTGRVFYIDWPVVGRRAARPVRSRREHPHAHFRQAGIQGRRNGGGAAARSGAGPRAADASRTAAPSSSTAGSRLRCRPRTQATNRREPRVDSDHRGHGAQRLCRRDPGAAARGQDQRPPDPARTA